MSITRSAIAAGLLLALSGSSVAQTAGGMSDITVLSVDIGHFDHGDKIIHVYENSRNQTDNRNAPGRWQFVIEPLLSTQLGVGAAPRVIVQKIDPEIVQHGKHSHRRSKHRVIVPLSIINNAAREQALGVVVTAYQDNSNIKCAIGRRNVDVLPITELTIAVPEIEDRSGLFYNKARIFSRTQHFLTSPLTLFISFDVWEEDDSDDKMLKRFVEFLPYLQIDASVSFSVKSTRFNKAVALADKLKTTELYVALNGTGGVGYVTRNDLRKLAQSASNSLRITAIIEDPENFSADLFNNLLAYSTVQTADEAFFNSEAAKSTYHADDLKPDVITRELNKVFTKDQSKDEWHFNSSGSANANFLDIIGGGFEASLSGSQLKERLKEQNIESDIQGNKIVAKSIQLEQINISNFVASYTYSIDYRNISGSAKSGLKTVIYGKPAKDTTVSSLFANSISSCSNKAALAVQ